MASLFSSLMGGKVKQSAGAQLLERMSTATQVRAAHECQAYRMLPPRVSCHLTV